MADSAAASPPRPGPGKPPPGVRNGGLRLSPALLWTIVVGLAGVVVWQLMASDARVEKAVLGEAGLVRQVGQLRVDVDGLGRTVDERTADRYPRAEAQADLALRDERIAQHAALLVTHGEQILLALDLAAQVAEAVHDLQRLVDNLEPVRLEFGEIPPAPALFDPRAPSGIADILQGQ